MLKIPFINTVHTTVMFKDTPVYVLLWHKRMGLGQPRNFQEHVVTN